MIRHIVVWDFKEGYSYSEKKEYSDIIKRDMEALQGVVPEIKSIRVNINLLPTSDCEILLDSLFESVESLAIYQTTPDHRRVGQYIAEHTSNRRVVDFIED